MTIDKQIRKFLNKNESLPFIGYELPTGILVELYKKPTGIKKEELEKKFLSPVEIHGKIPEVVKVQFSATLKKFLECNIIQEKEGKLIMTPSLRLKLATDEVDETQIESMKKEEIVKLLLEEGIRDENTAGNLAFRLYELFEGNKIPKESFTTKVSSASRNSPQTEKEIRDLLLEKGIVIDSEENPENIYLGGWFHTKVIIRLQNRLAESVTYNS